MVASKQSFEQNYYTAINCDCYQNNISSWASICGLLGNKININKNISKKSIVEEPKL
jgi:hypothetical protein